MLKHKKICKFSSTCKKSWPIILAKHKPSNALILFHQRQPVLFPYALIQVYFILHLLIIELRGWLNLLIWLDSKLGLSSVQVGEG